MINMAIRLYHITQSSKELAHGVEADFIKSFKYTFDDAVDVCCQVYGPVDIESKQYGFVFLVSDNLSQFDSVKVAVDQLLRQEIDTSNEYLLTVDFVWKWVCDLLPMWQIALQYFDGVEAGHTEVYCFGTQMEYESAANSALNAMLSYLRTHKVDPSSAIYKMVIETAPWKHDDDYVGVVVVISNNPFAFLSKKVEVMDLIDQYTVEDLEGYIDWYGFRNQALNSN
jgi:hypothetical protein